jgi:hypothetical protein
MSICFCPRLSQATNLLPDLRAHLIAAASRHLLPEGFSFDLLPIVDDGIFGYELLPQRATHTYLTLGCDSGGKPVLRKSLYCAEAPSALRLAAANGRVLTHSELEAWHRIQLRDFSFPDWPSAAEAAWRDFSVFFPDGPRRSVEIHDARHRCLDEALAIAHSRLAEWDPGIDFCGVPDEAQYGIALTGATGESGQLMLRTAGNWTLRWEAAGKALHERWAAHAWEDDCGSAWASGGMTLGDTPFPRAPFVPVDAGATTRQR